MYRNELKLFKSQGIPPNYSRRFNIHKMRSRNALTIQNSTLYNAVVRLEEKGRIIKTTLGKELLKFVKKICSLVK